MASNDSLKRQQMGIVLKNRSEGKTREECAKIAKIPLSRINHWYKEGEQGFGDANIRFHRNLKAIEQKLENESKYKSEIKEYNSPMNINKRNKFLEYIEKGFTRDEASKKASINLKLIVKWDALGRRDIKPFKNFLKKYKNARNIAEKNKEHEKSKIKSKTISLIKKGNTINIAAKLVENGKYEKTILNWYNAGRLGNKNHAKFYKDCENAKKHQTVNKNKVFVTYKRLNKKEFKATVKGTIENNQYQSILRKLDFFENDIEKTNTKKVNGKTEILIIFRLDTSLLNSFKSKVKQLGWKNIN